MSSFTSDQETEHIHTIPTDTTALLIKTQPSHNCYEAVLSGGSDAETAAPDVSSEEKLPKLQMAILCYARVFEPIAFFAIFPIMNQMIFDTGEIREADVGFYSGLIESLFSITQMVFLIPFGRVADQIGRKPVLIFSICGVAVSTSLFGLSTTIRQMVFFRCLAGAFAGMIVTLGTMLAENSTPRTRARAFALFAFAGNLGVFLGPLLGGTLAEAAQSAMFRGTLFERRPYALPTFAVGGIGFSAAAVCLFAKETLPKKTATPTTQMSVRAILKSPGVYTVLMIYGQVMTLAFAHAAVVPVFWFTPIKLGGFGFRPLLISIFSGLSGFSQIAWLLAVFPWLQRRYSTGAVLRGCAAVYPIYFALYPVCNALLRYGLKGEFWTIAPLVQILGSGTSMCFEAMQLCLNDVNPTPETLGTLNALGLFYISGIRAVTPAGFSSLYALGVGKQILGGYLGWVVMVVQAFGFMIVVRWLPKEAEGDISL